MCRFALYLIRHGKLLVMFNDVCFILDAVSARFKIDPNRFVKFFRTCLRRTLAQMKCDVRRTLRRNDGRTAVGRAGNEDNGNARIDNVSVRNSVGPPDHRGSHDESAGDRLNSPV